MNMLLLGLSSDENGLLNLKVLETKADPTYVKQVP
jgi:hypothetical protein